MLKLLCFFAVATASANVIINAPFIGSHAELVVPGMPGSGAPTPAVPSITVSIADPLEFTMTVTSTSGKTGAGVLVFGVFASAYGVGDLPYERITARSCLHGICSDQGLAPPASQGGGTNNLLTFGFPFVYGVPEIVDFEGTSEVSYSFTPPDDTVRAVLAGQTIRAASYLWGNPYLGDASGNQFYPGGSVNGDSGIVSLTPVQQTPEIATSSGAVTGLLLLLCGKLGWRAKWRSGCPAAPRAPSKLPGSAIRWIDRHYRPRT